METANGLVSFEQSGQTAFKDCFSLIFVKLPHYRRIGKPDAGFPAGITHERESVFLPDARARAGAVKKDFVPRPILAEKAGLRFSEFGQLVVVRLKERSLRMTDEKTNPTFRSVPPSNVVPHEALRWMPFVQFQTEFGN